MSLLSLLSLLHFQQLPCTYDAPRTYIVVPEPHLRGRTTLRSRTRNRHSHIQLLLPIVIVFVQYRWLLGTGLTLDELLLQFCVLRSVLWFPMIHDSMVITHNSLIVYIPRSGRTCTFTRTNSKHTARPLMNQAHYLLVLLQHRALFRVLVHRNQQIRHLFVRFCF